MNFDFYAMLIALGTLPLELILFNTNVEKTERVTKGGGWGTVITEYYLSETMFIFIITIAIASVASSLYLINKTPQNTSTKSILVKILCVINVIGTFITLSLV